jgi:DNA-binding NarL/FixJ family response regulator
MAKPVNSLPSVVFIEDEILLLGLLSEYFIKSGSFTVAGAFSLGADALRKICTNAPDLVVLDLQLPDANGLTIVQQIKERVARPPQIVVLSSSTNPLVVKQLLRLGVRGILQKGISAGEVLAACQRVMRGGICLELADGDMVELAAAPFSSGEPMITGRETEILDLVVRGKRSKEIADTLGLSVRTVDKHRENLMRKVGAHDVGGLVRYAAQHGLIPSGIAVENGEDKKRATG